MANEEIYFVKLASWLARALGQGASFTADLDTDGVGVRMPESIATDSAVQGAGLALANAGGLITEAANALEVAQQSGDESALISAFVQLAQGLITFFDALRSMVSVIDSLTGSIPDPAERQAIEDLIAVLARRMADYLILSVLELRQPRFTFLLKLLGLIEWESVDADPAKPLSQGYVKKTLQLQRLKDLITDPGQHFINAFKWGQNDFDPGEIFRTAAGFYQEEASIDVGELAGEPFLRRGIFRWSRDSSMSPPGLKLDITATFDRPIDGRIEANENWGVGLDTTLRFTGGVVASLSPPFSVAVTPKQGEFIGQFKIFVNRNPSASPFDIIGGNSLVTLSAEDVSVGAGISARPVTATGVTVSPLLFSDLKGLTLRLGSEDADSFIADLLSEADVEGRFDVGLEWRGDEGLVIKASGGIEIAIPIHQSLGFVEFKTLYILLTIRDDGALSLETSTSLTGLLGPLSASVERMGAQLDLRFTDDANARFGFFDLDLGFKPPDGIGLSVDAGIVKGGGYLRLDFEKGEYAGALELVFSEFLTLKAIGLITTRLPDGSKGFSLVIIITAEFGSPIQLGFGFTLNGVGGLLGLNRTLGLEVIATGVRTGAVESILFPTDVIENAPRIISDLREFFPPAQDIFLIGPMAKLGWGTPTLVSASLGIIIEIPPGNIVILGVLKIALPDEDAALLVLQVNFIGAMEFGKKRIWFFASMYESRVLFMTIEGGMGLLVAWGTDANFVVSVGGFHPAFNPPPLPFPGPDRISINILNTPVARIRVMAYFAVTSNTAQFGARAELFFGLSEFGIEGHIAFDALFQFSPFYFIITISASLSAKVFGIGLFSVHIRGELEGTSPWYIEGEGSISLLFFNIDVPFSHSWGQDEDTTLPPIQVMPLLEAEFNKLENWTAELPSANNFLVSLRKIESIEDLVLHPVGVLRISQRAVPLDLVLDKVGNQKPSDVVKIVVEVPGADLQKHSDTQEQFAIAQFKEFSDSNKLSSPAYEKQKAGVELSVAGDQLKSDAAVKRVVRYEEIIIDSNFKEHVKRFVVFAADLFIHFLRGSAASKSLLSAFYKSQKAPIAQKVSVESPSYVVASNVDNSGFSAEAKFTSQVKANEFMQEQINRDPKLAEGLHVIPATEMKEAA